MSLTARFAVAIAAVLFVPAFGASSIIASSINASHPAAAASFASSATPSTVADVVGPTTHATPIPEPTTLAPLAGMAIVAMRRRRVAA